MRFSEAIALTPADFDFSHQLLSVNKTWNYKDGGGFQPTKNKSSVRKIQLDWMIVSQFSALVKDLPVNEPIFVEKAIFNSTINNILNRHCTDLGIPVITIHGLRHPYVKHTTKKYNSEKQKTQATKIVDLIAWGFCFCIVSYSKRSWTL